MLIDCAGLEGGKSRIPQHAFAELECLFIGDLAIELGDVGPYLGRLRSFAPEVQAIAQGLLNKQVGMLLLLQERARSTTTFSQLHRHFRKFNVVYGPNGNPLFFRYYDPRVVADVLSVLSMEQLAAFFGPLETLVLVDLNGQLICCKQESGRLTSARCETSE